MDAGQGLRALEQHTEKMLSKSSGVEICAVPLGALIECLRNMQGTRFTSVDFVDQAITTLAEYYELAGSTPKRLQRDFGLSRASAYRCRDTILSRGLIPYRSVSADTQVQGMLKGKRNKASYKEVVDDVLTRALPECAGWAIPDNEAPSAALVEYKGVADVYMGMNAFKLSLWLSHLVYTTYPRDMPLGTTCVARLVGSMYTSLCLDPKELYARIKFGMKTRPGDKLREAGTAPEGRIVRER